MGIAQEFMKLLRVFIPILLILLILRNLTDQRCKKERSVHEANNIFPALFPLKLAYSGGVASVIYKDKAYASILAGFIPFC